MVRGSSSDIRLAARKEHSLPIVASLKPWFEKQRSMISSGSTPGTSNPVENAIRPVCLNALFAWHEVGSENWALLASLVATCKLNDVNPTA